jgi:trans-aconitate 2-methyltransferase
LSTGTLPSSNMTQASGTDWDAQRYHRVAQPHAAWGANVLDRLRLRGHETVLDAGCGSGKVTAQLLERLPHGRVIGVDVSQTMLAEAATNLSHFQRRLTLSEANLLDVDQAIDPRSVDAVFSTATFHWIDDHPRLFRALHAVMRPGAQLVAQYGGGSNLADFMRATDTVAEQPVYAGHLQNKHLWRFYSSPEQTREDLNNAGFTSIETWLEASPQSFADAEALKDFARAVVLRVHLAALPEPLRDLFATEVIDQIHRRQGGYVLDYVRLNVDATAA